MPFPWLIVSTLISAGATIKAGVDAKNAGDRNAFSIETDRILTEAETKQKHSDRIEEYEVNLSSNTAQFAAQGVDSSSMSVKAFLDKQQDIAFSDVERSNFMGQMQASKLSIMAANERQRGRDAMTAGYLGAFGTLASGMYKYNYAKSSPPSGGGSGSLIRDLTKDE